VAVVNPSLFDPIYSSFKKSIIEITGEDASSFLHSQTTIDINLLKSGDFKLACVLPFYYLC